MQTQKTYLTSEGLDKLKAELEDLKNNQRPAVIKRIEEALAQGDLKENSEYDDAKNTQGFIEGRIAEIETLVKTAEIVSGNSGNGVVDLGDSVKVKHNGSSSTFRIVGPAEADPTAGLISNESPLGQALLGKTVGDDVKVETPKGATAYKIVSAG
jgi:transcription elongation factor GreA